MYKIKIFKVISERSLESTINNWFREHSNIEIFHTDYFSSSGWYGYSIIYKEKDTGNDSDEMD